MGYPYAQCDDAVGVRRGAAGHVCRRWRRVHLADFHAANGGFPLPSPSDSEPDADGLSDASVGDSDPDLTQTYSLPPSVLEAVEAQRGRVGGLP